MCARTILLASGSPRRRELLALLGLAFDVIAVDVDESPRQGETPAGLAVRLARAKAQCAAQAAPAGVVVIAADTIVSLDGLPLGKPASAAEARHMLRELRGRVHQVYTAIALLDMGGRPPVCDLAATDVPMRAYSEQELEAYIASGDPLDKAGAYAIQHTGFHPVRDLHGCFANVMGLPLCHLARSLASLAVPFEAGVASACQRHVNYACPVYPAILSGSPGSRL